LTEVVVGNFEGKNVVAVPEEKEGKKGKKRSQGASKTATL
jgi:hypothetical protein